MISLVPWNIILLNKIILTQSELKDIPMITSVNFPKKNKIETKFPNSIAFSQERSFNLNAKMLLDYNLHHFTFNKKAIWSER